MRFSVKRLRYISVGSLASSGWTSLCHCSLLGQGRGLFFGATSAGRSQIAALAVRYPRMIQLRSAQGCGHPAVNSNSLDSFPEAIQARPVRDKPTFPVYLRMLWCTSVHLSGKWRLPRRLVYEPVDVIGEQRSIRLGRLQPTVGQGRCQQSLQNQSARPAFRPGWFLGTPRLPAVPVHCR
ncbi:hypothetical protein FF011L_41490 [Roseimaritima multifibrata]|uniref:Uncharacterized protein n=1 Tax=Roseimaritima multifibrata TaxID=1930274 RepID=A0A517MKE5_9BACT|nr:hypothetical protein FF011L_41490 [Roseimaritima multifibrata]